MASNRPLNAVNFDILQLFSEHLQLEDEPHIAVISFASLHPEAKNAIEKSLSALKFPDGACCFISVTAESGSKLDTSALELLIESLDPYALIVSDCDSAELVCEVYTRGTKDSSDASMVNDINTARGTGALRVASMANDTSATSNTSMTDNTKSNSTANQYTSQTIKTYNTCIRLNGRSVIVFNDLYQLIQNEKGKRLAWELFKLLG